jgi:hypothetical protein
MESLINIKPFIGLEKTLLITCQDFIIEDFASFGNKVFVHFTPESKLLQHDLQSQEILKHYIEIIGCTQIIVIGYMNEAIINNILDDHSLHSPQAALKFNLEVFLKNRRHLILNRTKRNQILMELSVIAQCKVLMDFYFIRPRTEKKWLRLRGVVFGSETSPHKSIFFNGIIYNDMLSMN